MNAVLKPVAQAVVEIYHAKYGASGWSGWGNCPAWIGGGAASIYAAKGSVTHEVSAECLTTEARPSDYIGRSYSSDGFDITFDADLASIATSYVHTVRELHASMGGELLVEQGFDLEYITKEPGARSTLDFAIVPAPGSTELVIGDLKTGMGVPVAAEGNGQLVIYALLAYDEYSLVADIKTVRMIIIQPPLNSVTEWVITVEELEQWRERVVAAAAAAQAPNPVPVPSDKSCRWCSKAATCSALQTQVFEAVDAAPTDEPLSTDELALAMSKADMIEGWIKAIRSETEKRLLDGRTVFGYKLVQGKKGNRQWSNATEVEALFKTMRLKEAEMYDFKLVSPTTADKLAKAGTIGPKQWTKVQQMITQSEGSLSVAPINDKRPAVTPAAQEFQPIETGVPG